MEQTVGFIGLGVLGSAVAGNFIQGGLNVVGFDVSRTACDTGEAMGVKMAASPAELAPACQMLKRLNRCCTEHLGC